MPARGEGEPGPARDGVGEEAEGGLVVELGRGEAGNLEMREDRPEVGRVAVDREVEGDPGGGRQLDDLVFEHAAVAGVDEVERPRVGEVVRVEPEPRHADVGADEDAVALDQRHVGKGIRSFDDADPAGVDALGAQPAQYHVAGAVGADRTEVRRLGTGPRRGHGDVQGVAAREHAPEVVVTVDDVVAGAEDPHLSTRP